MEGKVLQVMGLGARKRQRVMMSMRLRRKI